ncbi:MAG TPA: GAF domain-containing sensor histidine kinase [Chthoniobacterales bacterium]|nr:GAF domain-containing sensor histidine kinase [Chthoniobacterales bacterium]
MTPLALEAIEEKRLSELRRSGLLDSPSEKIFDHLTELAAKVLKVPVALMSLVDADRQFFKSQVGLPDEWAQKRETPLSHSFCQYVAGSNEPLIISDAREYPLVCDNLAVRDLNVVAYAGVPLITPTGQTLGSFCAVDVKPRVWTSEDVEILRALAAQVMTEVNLRMQLGELNHDLDQVRKLDGERLLRVRQNVHALRTPVITALAGLDAIEMAGPLNEKQRQYWSLTKSNARTLRELVDQLLKVGSIEEEGAAALSLHECSPREMVNRALDRVAPLADRAAIPLDYSAVKELPAIQADEREIVRVLVNLMANAVKFTPRGRGVAICLDEIGRNGTAAVRFSVIDQGIGIAPKDQQVLFSDGERLDHHADTDSSTGIGLVFCKHIVEAHGGEIAVQSAIGAGSTFSFFIPRQSSTSLDRVGFLAPVKD